MSQAAGSREWPRPQQERHRPPRHHGATAPRQSSVAPGGDHVVDDEHAAPDDARMRSEPRTNEALATVLPGLGRPRSVPLEEATARQPEVGGDGSGDHLRLIEATLPPARCAGRRPRDEVDVGSSRQQASSEHAGDVAGDLAAILVLEPEQDVADPTGVGSGDDDALRGARRRTGDEGEATRPAQPRTTGMASSTTTCEDHSPTMTEGCHSRRPHPGVGGGQRGQRHPEKATSVSRRIATGRRRLVPPPLALRRHHRGPRTAAGGVPSRTRSSGARRAARRAAPRRARVCARRATPTRAACAAARRAGRASRRNGAACGGSGASSSTTSSWRSSANASTARPPGRPTSAVIATLVTAPSAVHVRSQPVDHGSGVGEAAGAGERHHRVHVVEHVPRLVGRAARPRVGERGEAAARVDAVEVRRHSRALASSISRGTPAELVRCGAGVVDGEDLGVMPGLELEQREVPPVVDGEQVARAPVVHAAAQEPDAVVDRPRISSVCTTAWIAHTSSGLASTAASPASSALLVVASTPRVRRRACPRTAAARGSLGSNASSGAAGRSRRLRGVAEEEVEEVADLQRQQVGGPCEEDLIEDGRGAQPITAEPCANRRHVHRRMGVHRRAPHLPVSCSRRGELRHVGGGEAEVRHQRIAHREVGMFGGQRAGQLDDLGLVAQQQVEGAFVRVGLVHVRRSSGFGPTSWRRRALPAHRRTGLPGVHSVAAVRWYWCVH